MSPSLDGPQTEPSAFERRIHQRLSFFEFVLGELDDQDCVFCGQSDEHDQADLRVNIAFDLDHVGGREVSQ